MDFEHVIQINEPSEPHPLTRDQLWNGLVLRAEQPQLFVMGLDRCCILSRTQTTLERELHYGHALVRDRVVLNPKTCVRYETLATDTHIGGSLTMTIEQLDGQPIFLRFAYHTTLALDDSEDARQTREIVKSAYQAADIDTVRLIRQYTQNPDHSVKLH